MLFAFLALFGAGIPPPGWLGVDGGIWGNPSSHTSTSVAVLTSRSMSAVSAACAMGWWDWFEASLRISVSGVLTLCFVGSPVLGGSFAQHVRAVGGWYPGCCVGLGVVVASWAMVVVVLVVGGGW